MSTETAEQVNPEILMKEFYEKGEIVLGGGSPPAEPPAIETPVTGPPTIADPPAEEVVITPATETAAPVYDFSKFGVNSEDELSARMQRLQELETKAAELDKFDQVKSKINNPYADERIAKINSFVKDTGIKDLGLAQQIVSTTAEDLAKDPIKTIAYKEILNNPDILNYLTPKDVEDAVRQRLNVEEGDTELPPLARLEAANASKEVQTKVAGLSTTNTDVYINLLQEQERLASDFQIKATRATNDVEKAVSKYSTLNVKVGGEDLSLAVSPDILQQVKGYATEFAKHLPENETYQQSIDGYITSILKTSMEDQIFTAYKSKIEGSLKEAAIKNAHNGGPVIHKDKPTDGSTNQIPEYQQAQYDFIRKTGGTVPS